MSVEQAASRHWQPGATRVAIVMITLNAGHNLASIEISRWAPVSHTIQG